MTLTMKPMLSIVAAGVALSSISCSAHEPLASNERRYFYSPLPVQGKMGLTYVEKRTVSREKPTSERRYHYSPIPVKSKMGLTRSSHKHE